MGACKPNPQLCPVRLADALSAYLPTAFVRFFPSLDLCASRRLIKACVGFEVNRLGFELNQACGPRTWPRRHGLIKAVSARTAPGKPMPDPGGLGNSLLVSKILGSVGCRVQKAPSGTRTQPSISTLALRLMMALVTTH